LIVGDADTTNGTDITTNALTHTVDAYKYASNLTHEINFPFLTDLANAGYASGNLFEMSGMGYLEGKDGTIANIENGWMGRLFFQAPLLTATVAAPIAGSWYQVLSGSVTYNGVVYTAGSPRRSYFKITAATAITIAVDTQATFSLALPPEMRNTPCENLDEQFRIKHLLYGDEPAAYFTYDTPSGFEPRNSLISVDNNFIGYSR
jgi:hypothetical protein